MAICAGIRNLVSVGHLRADKPERVAANIDIGDDLFDFRHVPRDTLVAISFQPDTSFAKG